MTANAAELKPVRSGESLNKHVSSVRNNDSAFCHRLVIAKARDDDEET
jgi:hypothetical protein